MPTLPPALLAALSKLDHFNERAFCETHQNADQLVSVRFNPAKIEDPRNIAGLPFSLAGRVPWSTHGYYLAERPSFTLDPLFHAGAYYVQEASGMFLEQAMRHTVDLSRPLKVLDLCAAPGGKSTLIQSLITPDSLLLSNEVIKTRVPVLHQHMSKWGLMNGLIANNDPRDFKRFPGYFDLLFIDAPCSGSGLFRKDPQAIGEWSAASVLQCSQRQQRILADAWDCLREQGVLIYSTCSYSTEENEDILDILLDKFDAESLRIPIDVNWNIIETHSEKKNGYGYRFYPDQLQGEGFFLCAVRKKSAVHDAVRKARTKPEAPGKRELAALRRFLPDEEIHFIQMESWVHALPRSLIDAFLTLKHGLYLKKAGILAGRAGSDEWVPDHELALSTAINPDLPHLELTRENALKYLRRDVFTADSADRGWITVSFGGQKLGWVKMLPGRMNNYFPKSWRVLM